MQQFGAKIGYPGEHGRPVGAHLLAPGEGSAGVGRLRAAVVRVEQGCGSVEIMGVHGADEPIHHLTHTHPTDFGEAARAR